MKNVKPVPHIPVSIMCQVTQDLVEAILQNPNIDPLAVDKQAVVNQAFDLANRVAIKVVENQTLEDLLADQNVELKVETIGN